jgi:hypothetical protein
MQEHAESQESITGGTCMLLALLLSHVTAGHADHQMVSNLMIFKLLPNAPRLCSHSASDMGSWFAASSLAQEYLKSFKL